MFGPPRDHERNDPRARQEAVTTTRNRSFVDLHAEAGWLPGTPTIPEGELVARFHQRIRLFAARRVEDAAAAEDVAQETLSRVIEALRANRVEHTEALPAFVFQTARNVCLHWVRSATRERGAFTRLEHETASPNDAGDPLGALISEERARTVRAALDRLDADDRALLTMLFFHGLDALEVSRRLVITTATLRVRKHRALRRLATRLGEKE
jgi:RNA polymerase sigma-70 factor (ECF subfamily)